MTPAHGGTEGLDAPLRRLDVLVGTWSTEATHPAMPGLIVRGTAVVEWLEGRRFLIHRARTDHPEFPHSISIIGFSELDRVEDVNEAATAPATPLLRMHYFDSRGVSRIYEAAIDDSEWRLWRDAQGFSQRFTGTFADHGRTIVGLWQLRRDDVHWHADLAITYRRA